jgi:hypothetical protein
LYACPVFPLDQNEPAAIAGVHLDDGEDAEQRIILDQVPDHIVVLGDSSVRFAHSGLLRLANDNGSTAGADEGCIALSAPKESEQVTKPRCNFQKFLCLGTFPVQREAKVFFLLISPRHSSGGDIGITVT